MLKSNVKKNTLKAHSALTYLHTEQPYAYHQNQGVVLQEIPFLGMVRLQGPGANKSFCEAITKAGFTLPDPCQMTKTGKIRCMWLTPNEWLFVVPPGKEADVTEGLTPYVEGYVALVTEISDSRLAISVSGPSAADLLMQACALDLHPSVFKIGRCAVTRFAQVPAMISHSEENRYELYVDRSQAGYIWEWLVDAARESG